MAKHLSQYSSHQLIRASDKSALLGLAHLPAEIEFRDELPKTMVGKLSKKELRAGHGGTKS